jgi:hypothetical protein
MIAVQYPGAAFLGHLLVHRHRLLRLLRTKSWLMHHGYGVCRTHLRAYSTAFAVFHIYPDGYGFANDGIRAIEPA